MSYLKGNAGKAKRGDVTECGWWVLTKIRPDFAGLARGDVGPALAGKAIVLTINFQWL
jgi:hypothetical protein